ncbi:MAG TPA: nuclear transport factor 2 family protein [Solirubrobacteraceae bacterium]|jgi:ketosteroid isomerase-like protein|nr:nuclear transport factor 2 family protein [Solirubrobacteraceae bacterium]
MSQENVALIMGLLDTPEVDVAQVYQDEALFAAAVETVSPYLDPGFAVTVRGGPAGDQTFVGVLGFKAFWQDWLTPFESYRQEIDRAVDLGDRVLLLIRDFARLKGSDEEVRGDHAAVWSIRDGKITAAEFYASRSEALDAVGLSE